MDLIFIHGAADSGAVWDMQLEHFGKRHRLLAVDLPGHGERLGEAAFERVEESAREVCRLTQTHALERPVLVGHSMGGAIALTIALAEPGLPQALVLVGSGARLRIPSVLIEDARRRAEVAPSARIADRVIPLDDVVSPHASAETRAWLREHFGRSTGQAAYADFVATNAFDVMGRLEAVSAPTLVVGGEDDRWTPPKFQRYFAEHIPEARLVMLPHCGHYPFVEAAEAFNRELERFLADLEGWPP